LRPVREKYKARKEYDDALEVWDCKRLNAIGLPSVAQQNRWEHEKEIAKVRNDQLAAKCHNETATLSERLAYNRATG
jgi:hypothetical protein